MKKAKLDLKNVKNFKKLKSKNVCKIVLVFLLCWGSIFIFLNKDNILNTELTMFWVKDKFTFPKKSEGFPFKIPGEKISAQNFKLMSSNILITSDTNYICIDKSAGVIKMLPHSFYNPVMKTCEDKVIIYDLNGQELQVGFKSNVIEKIKTEKKIISAAVSKNGVFATCSLTASGSTELEIFKVLKKEPILEMKFNEEHLNDVTLNKNGSIAVVTVNFLKDNEVASKVKVIDTKNKKEKFTLESLNNLFFFVDHISNKNVLVIGDNALCVVNNSNGTQKEYNFSNNKLLAFDIYKDNGFAVALSTSESGNDSEISIFNKNGNLKKHIKTNLKITALSYNYNRIAALSDGFVYFYDLNGREVGKIDCGKEAKNIKLLSDRKVFVLNPRQILLKSLT